MNGDIDTITGWQIHPNGWSVVTTTGRAVYTGRGEFYSGLTTGAPVTVQRTSYFRHDGTLMCTDIQVSTGGAWLALDGDTFLTEESE